MAIFYFYKTAKILYNLLPPSFCYIMARWIGNIVFFIAKTNRGKVEDNLRKIQSLSLDKKQSKFVARRIYQNFNVCLVDFLRAQKINKTNLDKIIKFKGIENLNNALAFNKGVIIASGHIGNWELGGIGLAILGYPMNIVYLSHGETRLDNLFIAQRVAKGERMLRLGTDTKKIFSVLADKEVLVIVSDIDMGDSDTGIEVDFLGSKALFPRGPAALSVKTGAAIVPGFNIMTGYGKYTSILEEPIIAKAGENKDVAILSCTQKFATILEGYIKKYPEQWFAFGNIGT